MSQTRTDTHLLFIDGDWTAGGAGEMTLVNPADGRPIGTVAAADEADMDRAALAAARAFVSWRNTPPPERGAILRRAAADLRARADDIAPQLTREQGKTLFEARYEVIASADSLEWFAEEARRGYGRIVPARIPGVSQMVLKEPVGPAIGFVPWNFAMGQAARKLGAALAAGCTMVLKGAEETPATCVRLVEALVGAGLPRGVVSLLFGDPARLSSYLIPHPAVRKISFTGSTAVGKQLAAIAGANMKPITMELGGHAPVIITADVDIAPIARMLVAAKFRNAGQVCTAPTRFLIEAPAYDAFVDSFASLAAALRVGDGLAEGTEMGPLANTRRIAALDALIADARQRGASLRTGGARVGNSGNFFAPTVLERPSTDSRIMNEEPFGPVALMLPFETLDSAIAEANRLDFGLAAYAFTRSDRAATEIAARVDSGMVSINQFGIAWPEIPFGGIKDSGHGSEGGTEAMEAYMITKFVSRAAL